MKSPTLAWCALSWLVTFSPLPRPALAQTGPQDHWVFEDARGWRAATPAGDLYGDQIPWGIATDSQHVFVAETKTSFLKVYTRDGALVRSWGGGGSGDYQFSYPLGVALDGTNVLVADANNGRIQVFTKEGTHVRKWGTTGSGNGQFSGPTSVAVDETHVYVSDAWNYRIQVFTKDGAFVRKWGRLGSVAGEFNAPYGIAVDRQAVYVADRANSRIQVFSKTGAFLRSWSTVLLGGGRDAPWAIAVDDDSVYATFYFRPNGLLPWQTHIRVYDKQGNLKWARASDQSGGVFSAACGVALDNPYVFVADAGLEGVVVLRRIYRTLGAVAPSAIPLGEVVAVRQRDGVAVLDVDYTVAAPDDPTVTVRAGAFAVTSNSVPHLADFVPMRTFVDGTSSNTGPGLVPGTLRRLSWDMKADGVTNQIPRFGNVKVAVMAKDSGGLLDLHLLHIPAVGTNEAFAIDRTPLQQSDLLPLWFWLLSSGDTNIVLSAGTITGIRAPYLGETLAEGTNTTDRGRAYLFEQAGVREATPVELGVAREASTPGSVVQWTPRREPPEAGAKVNAFNFQTSPTNGWWVVPRTP